MYVKTNGEDTQYTVEQLLGKTKRNQENLRAGYDELIQKLNDLGIEAI